jgi:ubiquinone biosynthesis protein
MMDGVLLEEYIDITSLKEIASGSIGQVYYAKRLDGTELAIKVKHPDIDKDLEDQSSLVTFIKWIQSIDFIRKKYSLFFNIDDFLNDINLQCDFNNEADNSKLLAQCYEDSTRLIVFPKILFQSRDMLISEYIPAYAFETLSDFQKSQATLAFVCFFYQMLLVDNLIHGDLHCKNWKVRISPDNNTDAQLVIYDCGICFKNIDVDLSRDFWFAIGKYDIDQLCKTVKKFIVKTKYDVSDDKIDSEIKKILVDLEGNNLGTSILLKSILHFFSSNDIIVHKFLLNLSILMCVTEEFFKKTNIINSAPDRFKEFNIYDLINESHLDVIAFTETKNCFKKVGKIFKEDLTDKYQKYNDNIQNNNIDTNGKTIEKKLFSNLVSSNLKFKPPE